MSLPLCVLFFVSGAAGLLFETLWFRQAGLALGNSVSAAALVTSSFMAGLALGGAAARSYSVGRRAPLRLYAALEALVAVTGSAITWALPALWPAIAAATRPFAGHAASLGAVRFVLAFAALVVPATALGATLPVLVEAAGERGSVAGALGWLYGCNTLGAVAGALAGEFALIEALGVRGASLVASGLDLSVAGAALVLSRAAPGRPDEANGPPGRVALGAPAVSLLAATALAGAILLALETLWLRLLLLFVCGTSVAFAMELAVVLFGLGCGGVAAGFWTRRSPRAAEFAPAVALAAGMATAGAYAWFRPGAGACGWSIALVALPLVLPASLLSGALFPLLGDAVRARLRDPRQSAGALVAANTAGALLGGVLGTFALLPALGIESSIYLVSVLYAGVAVLSLERGAGRAPLVALGVSGALLAGVLLAFPVGRMTHVFVPAMLKRFASPGRELVAYREGLTETSAYLRDDLWGTPVAYRLVTNGFSMAGTGYNADRYTRLFVNLAVALRPAPRRALLVCYGVGSTATALVRVPSLQTIDVVDISRDILDLARRVFPREGHPLLDPRVRVHVEDGRQFLLAGGGEYDLITGEPPPPHNAGIVNLYTREHFELLSSRLALGGVATYWLPVHSLTRAEALSITRSFCDAFPDCSLWKGIGYDWVLAGSRGGVRPPGLEGVRAAWLDPGQAEGLREIGFESPAALGATFAADSATLAQWTQGSLPLTDDHPYRLSPRVTVALDPGYAALVDASAAKARFAASPWVARVWPEALREETLAAFSDQDLIDRIGMVGLAASSEGETAERVLHGPRRAFLTLWLAGLNPAAVLAADAAFARGGRDSELVAAVADGALSRGDAARAARLWSAVPPAALGRRQAFWSALASCESGDPVAALAAWTRSGGGGVPAWLARCPGPSQD